MAVIKTAFGTTGQTLTLTMASLASSATAGRESLVVDNRTDLFLDALVSIKAKTSTGTIANDKALYVFAYATVDDGTTYPDTITGADAAITFNDPTQLVLLGAIFMPAVSTTYKGGPWSVAKSMGGVLPAKWGIAIRNYSGVALTATEGDHSKLWQGTYATVV